MKADNDLPLMIVPPKGNDLVQTMVFNGIIPRGSTIDSPFGSVAVFSRFGIISRAYTACDPIESSGLFFSYTQKLARECNEKESDPYQIWFFKLWEQDRCSGSFSAELYNEEIELDPFDVSFNATFSIHEPVQLLSKLLVEKKGAIAQKDIRALMDATVRNAIRASLSSPVPMSAGDLNDREMTEIKQGEGDWGRFYDGFSYYGLWLRSIYMQVIGKNYN